MRVSGALPSLRTFTRARICNPAADGFKCASRSYAVIVNAARSTSVSSGPVGAFFGAACSTSFVAAGVGAPGVVASGEAVSGSAWRSNSTVP